ncbi:adenylate cyclase associated N terminal-domain-containing protein [Lentinula aff. detonsa]|uniref:Adenylyl cyclase-associated protein n=1 Tax=Lentinula aff. detonsa TaxID=2804958 RepID=A0AA38KFH3_9AGAR|nr:adenylate cyclase associated N terminal-domain-containing protein [Lentinula aff. detonsa]KAJ3802933.1 adenylate cyclase associated N terminal-domain-containing protein [Lentinula aff. detonsa]
MSSQGLHSLTTIIKRLEAATSRIEDLAAAGWPTNKPDTSEPANTPSSYAAAPSLPVQASSPAASAPAAITQQTPKSVVVFDEVIIDGKVKPFVELTKSFAGSSVVEIIGLVEKQFTELRELIQTAAFCVKPDEQTFQSLLAPFHSTIEAINRLKEANRKDRAWFMHLMVVSEASPFVAWVLNSKPGPHISETKDQALYYGNRVIKEFKEKDARHVEWVRGFAAALEETRKYVVEYHTTGLTWNSKGIPVAQYVASKSAGAPAASLGGPPPPPPPPPPPAAPPVAAGSAVPPAGGTAAVFAEINRGADITRGLRKVDKSEMTHKNPNLRASSIVPSGSGSPPKKPVKPTKPQALMGKKPAKFALEGKAWNIEYQEDEKSLVVDGVELNQVVNLFGCKNSVIQIKGKLNAVTLVNCTKTQVLIHSVVSSISVTKSPSFAIQITGSAPMIQIDSCDTGMIYLSKESLHAEITTAKCSSINVNLPVEGEEEGVFEEQALPEMLRTCVKDGKLVTTVIEHVG